MFDSGWGQVDLGKAPARKPRPQVMEPLVIDQVPRACSALHVLICVFFLAWFSFKKGNNQWIYILFKGNSSKSEVATSFFSSPDLFSGAGRRPLRERGLLRVFSAAWPGVGRSGHPKSRKARFRWPGCLKAQREVCSKEPRGALKNTCRLGQSCMQPNLSEDNLVLGCWDPFLRRVNRFRRKAVGCVFVYCELLNW